MLARINPLRQVSMRNSPSLQACVCAVIFVWGGIYGECSEDERMAALADDLAKEVMADYLSGALWT